MIEQRTLGKNGPCIGRIGYGAMVLEGYYGQADEAQGIKTLHRALDVGMTMIDTADAYGAGHNESLIARAIKGRREQAFIATKFGVVFNPKEHSRKLASGWDFSLNLNASKDYGLRALDGSLKRLNVEAIDLWYAHYPDPVIPIEETALAMADAVKAGKVLHLGLSNVTADQVRRAHAIHPITAVQYEYSLWRREAETDLLPTLRELGIALVAWSPLGSGFLSGSFDIGANDMRQANPRYSPQNLAANQDRFAPILAIARELGVTPAQLALAWMLHQGEDIFPIPGTRRAERVVENAGAAAIHLDAPTMARINDAARPGLAEGATLI